MNNVRLEKSDRMEAAHKDNANKRVKRVQGTFMEAFASVVHEDAQTMTWIVEATSHSWKQITSQCHVHNVFSLVVLVRQPPTTAGW